MLDVATESFVGAEIYELVGLYIKSNHSHKKRTDSLEGSLGRVLLVAKLEFPKILIPRLNVPESQNGQNNSVLYM